MLKNSNQNKNQHQELIYISYSVGVCYLENQQNFVPTRKQLYLDL